MRQWLTVALLTTFLAGCSMGGGETGTGFDGKEQTTQGVITGFGSVLVNGVKYATDNATVLFDDIESSESLLKVGMLVTLDGKVDLQNNIGIANTIIFERDVEGEVITNNYVLDGTLDVMGQTVYVDNETIFESQVDEVSSFDLVSPGNFVEVSGYSDGSGQIFATRMEVKAASRVAEKIEVKGLVTDLSGLSFSLGSLLVDASNAEFEKMTADELANGLLVKVESESGVTNGILTATEVKLKERYIAKKQSDKEDEKEEVEIEGAVTEVVNTQAIYVNGQLVLINSETELENVDINALVVGARVIVEGEVTLDNEILASEIKGKKSSSSKLEGLITAINAETQAITVNGVEVIVNASTRVKDDAEESDEDERRFFNFANLSIGDKVEISFYTDATLGVNIATKLEREKKEVSQSSDEQDDGNGDENEGSNEDNDTGSDPDPDTDIDNDDSNSEDTDEVDNWEKKGLVSEIYPDAMTMKVEGISIDYSRLEEMIQVEEGDSVELKGYIEDGLWYVTEIEIED